MKEAFIDAAGLGVEIAVAVFLGAFLGHKADQYFRISPWGLVFGIFLGGIVGFWSVYKTGLKKK